jgi:hypothetical protein
MSIHDKYQSLIDLANQSGVSNLNITEGEGYVKIEGEAPSAEVKQALWDEYGRLDPYYRSGDLLLNIAAPESSTSEIHPGQEIIIPTDDERGDGEPGIGVDKIEEAYAEGRGGGDPGIGVDEIDDGCGRGGGDSGIGV